MISNHVCSLELSKQLVECGVVLEKSIYIWRKWEFSKQPSLMGRPPMGVEIASLSSQIEWEYPAPLTSEIAEVLPEQIGIYKLAGSWHCDWAESFGEKWSKTTDYTMVNAIAQMATYLKQNNLLGGV